MDKVGEFLHRIIFTFGDQQITILQLLFIPTVLMVAYLLTRWARSTIAKRLAARKVSPDIVHLVGRIIYILAAVVVVITILDFINVPLTAFAFVSGAIAIGVGFGAQNIINNFISGWILMWERPIRIGDFLEIGSDRGTVEAINTRSTRIRRTDGVHMLLPNSALLENTVVNWTLVDRLTRTSVRVGVAYGSDVKRVSQLILKAVVDQEATLAKPAPVVFFEDFGDNALIFDAYFWVQAEADRDLRNVRSNIRFEIDELFGKEKIVIAYPQRDLHLDGEITVVSRDQQ